MDGDDDITATRVLPMITGKFSIEDMLKGKAAAEPPPIGQSPSVIARDSQGFDADIASYSGQGDASSPPPKKSDPLPRPGDAYRAHARFLTQLSSEPRLIQFVLGDFTCEGFRYTDMRRFRWLAADRPGHGPAIVMRFVEAEVTEVRIDGRHLEDVHHWIGEGLMPWLWEQPPGFKTKDDTATVITRITISGAKGRLSGEG